MEYFKENAELDEKLVEWILAKQTSLEDCYEALAREDNELMKKQALDVENEPSGLLYGKPLPFPRCAFHRIAFLRCANIFISYPRFFPCSRAIT